MKGWLVLAATACMLWAGVVWAGVAAAGGARWEPAPGGRVPAGALAAGRAQGQELYVCKASYKNGEHVGKVFNRACHIGWGGEEVVLHDFQVLVEPGGVSWLDPRRRPARPVGGSVDGRRLLVCRARHQNGVHYGKEYEGRCHIGWGGREVAVDRYQILSAPGARWVRSSGAAPAGAVGGAAAQGREMFVCRARMPDGVHPGKLWEGSCHIGWGGREKKADSFEVLVAPRSLHWEPNQVGWADRCLKAAQGPRGWQCVCRAQYKNGVHVGKTVGGDCNIGWGGKEMVLHRFEVLAGGGPAASRDRGRHGGRRSPPGRGRPGGLPRADDFLRD
jgi:hypothetical protein